MKKLMFLLLVLLVATGCGRREIKKDMDFSTERLVSFTVDSVSLNGEKVKTIGIFTATMLSTVPKSKIAGIKFDNILKNDSTKFETAVMYDITKVNGITGVTFETTLTPEGKQKCPWITYANTSFWNKKSGGYVFDPSESNISRGDHPYIVTMAFKD